ncbi:glucose dehydrogenase [FAD, quinone]-like [Centruroides sculpturatus]|uniref:glucose dehydrogenase [FAD, quinone]-like n=1 Tax=Centruroides sculpturatus TaxID=218467 RepID=UPI000C6EF3E4|nr:glucose dehydrogenase [FAD, quinone]-like [Centruroides sculpturatus]
MKHSTLIIKYITLVFFLKLYIICARAVYQADYIIVGAGTAGSVLANRLSEPPHVTVLVLEAGDMAPLTSEIPLIPVNLAFTNYSWQFKSVPSKTIAQGLKNRQLLTVEGKALGGTTVLNFNLFVRGDYDNWARHGAIGWDWKSVYPYFLKLENNREYCNVYHGVGGNVIVQTPPFHAPITKGYLEAAIEIGYTPGDFNAKNQTVFQPPQGTVNRGARWSAVKAYINPARGRRNLWILTSAFVHKILIRNKQAYGVKFEHCGQLHEAYANKEVIICAGVFNSPKLLMLSGIGPKSTLRKFNIPVVADLPVGRNLQEQPSTFGMAFGANTFTYSARRITLMDFNEFLVNGTGPLTSLGGVDTIGFVNSKYNNDPDWPNIELLLFSLSGAVKSTGLGSVFNLNDEVYKTIFEPFTSIDTISCFPYPTRPRSRGYVTIRSRNPCDDPIIDFKFYSNPHDLKVMVEDRLWWELLDVDERALTCVPGLTGECPLHRSLCPVMRMHGDFGHWWRTWVRVENCGESAGSFSSERSG